MLGQLIWRWRVWRLKYKSVSMNPAGSIAIRNRALSVSLSNCTHFKFIVTNRLCLINYRQCWALHDVTKWIYFSCFVKTDSAIGILIYKFYENVFSSFLRIWFVNLKIVQSFDWNILFIIKMCPRDFKFTSFEPSIARRIK